MALIPPFSFDCVVGLGVREQDGYIEWVGTGTLVGRPFSVNGNGQNRCHVFLVTNRHVLKKLTTMVIRFNPRDASESKDFDIPLLDTNGNTLWKSHPDDEVDLAALGMDADFLAREEIRYEFFNLNDQAMALPEMKERGVSEGDFIYTLGFPMGIVDVDRLYVIARMGCIARLRDTLGGHRKDFLIDAFIFPGNSGGPVLYKPEITSIEGTASVGKAAFIGIVAGYLTFRDTAVSHQTGAARVIFEENAGLAVVHTVDQVAETVERCFKSARIKELA
ncbi:MAG: trypsin-like peptidase domain-containing protein [Candidatus Nitronauta litoralis]|uniref:Trypsin-like peptidase domain-containing protein n=1 Tax=Candidatus Nitronauta litoralis TaxID=2705533 RepID=A0A7T0BU84_9BACT|nr:MAG: trypsin-like peptidase domain-containing protein [Candidatus Nitronauta litoralis]